MRWHLLLAALLVLSTGCLSPSEESPASEPSGDEPGPSTEWERVTRSGTVSGVGTPAGSVSQGDGNTATWTVPADTRIMYLNVTTEGGELSIEYGPDCQTEDTVDCGNEASTEDGQASLVHEDPAAAGWEAYLFLENDAGEVDWEMTIATGVGR